MSKVDPRLVAAVRRHLAARPADATRVGWKYGSFTGLIVNGPVGQGDEVVADLGELGRVGLRIA